MLNFCCFKIGFLLPTTNDFLIDFQLKFDQLTSKPNNPMKKGFLVWEGV